MMTSGGSEQMTRSPQKGGENKASLEGLPLESSPYVKFTDLEDYKNRAYGTQGHLEPKPGHGGGSTDAPTRSGSSLSDTNVLGVEAVHKHVLS
ncbi:uncharacterized protein LOC115735964 [Rhodamnia argentea]|uniref:Uncharacterized protein LOC115735964 n=1 Tax=Rhodamnia argentea TaxID=178133 RepID=A0A8B8NMV5_9MYRT|nr:uncharacterized protein LOC115735964 [Rhodamnia argentea]